MQPIQVAVQSLSFKTWKQQKAGSRIYRVERDKHCCYIIHQWYSYVQTPLLTPTFVSQQLNLERKTYIHVGYSLLIQATSIRWQSKSLLTDFQAPSTTQSSECSTPEGSWWRSRLTRLAHLRQKFLSTSSWRIKDLLHRRVFMYSSNVVSIRKKGIGNYVCYQALPCSIRRAYTIRQFLSHIRLHQA